MISRVLDATYRARAIPSGSVRQFSWLFAALEARPPLLGIYALQAEWNALTDPRTERSAALIKLGWWQEEMRRLSESTPVHPISLYLANLPGASPSAFTPLVAAIDAAAVEVSGAPLERASDLEPHAQQLLAAPLHVVAALSAAGQATAAADDAGVSECCGELAVADYLARALSEYRREARAGRVVFAVDELLAVDIDNAALAADVPDTRLTAYLSTLRQRAADHYAHAGRALRPSGRRSQRHLLVLAALGAAHLNSPPPGALRSLYLAWSAARRTR
jgi:15-cis-phytoene synthase